MAITIAIITISPRLNGHTYAHNRWEAGSRCFWTIWVGDLLSPRSNYLPLVQNLRLQLSTPWPWGIVRSRLGGRAKDKVQTMISTDIMIPATGHPPLATRYLPPVTCHMPRATDQTLLATRHLHHASRCLASATQQVSALSMQKHIRKE